METTIAPRTSVMNDVATNRIRLCSIDDLIPGSGVAALWRDEQIAIFYLPDTTAMVFAVGNFDPFSNANVLSRGIVGDKNGEIVVASPIYKQHFSLLTGMCVEDSDVYIPTYDVSLCEHHVWLRP
ncbi:MAG: nitrite reductase small subunit NirD [Pseudomonadota bacterium]